MKENGKIENLKNNKSFYSCNKCHKTPQILFIDYWNNKIKINCEEHNINTLKINEYLDSLSQNDQCQNCFKKNDNSTDPTPRFCFNCNIILCSKCGIEHKIKNENHIIINNEDYNIKCKYHINEYYIGYCTTCKENICNECKRTRIHKTHLKYDYLEIHPTNNEFDIIDKFNHKIENEILNFQSKYNLDSIKNEKNNEINIISEKYTKNFEIINNKYDNLIKKVVEELRIKKEKEISDNINLKYEEIEKINIKYKKIENDYEQNFKIKIDNYKNIIKLNNIIVNSYKKQKDNNLYYNENIKPVIESINKHNEIYYLESIKNVKEKYKMVINNDMTSLKIKNNKLDNHIIDNIFNLQQFNHLKEIHLSSNLLTSIDFLVKNKFENLEILIIVGCNINNINILSKVNLQSLIELKISMANIIDINALIGDNFANLKILNLSVNKIKDINLLKDAKFNQNLKELYLDKNEINDLSVFNNNIFNNLKILSLSNNYIIDISPLEYILINKCEILTLDHNKINDINIFKKVKNFLKLKSLSLSNNPINIQLEENQKIIKMIKDKNINYY